MTTYKLTPKHGCGWIVVLVVAGVLASAWTTAQVLV